ncbi:MAG: hypothetical protein ABR498_02965, partial [Candidatus Dormibacteria bacterium]
MCDGVSKPPGAGAPAVSIRDLLDAARQLLETPYDLTPAACKQELLELSQTINLLELRRAHVAARFDEHSTEDDWGESTTAYNWMRHECKLGGGVTSRAIAVGTMAPQL